MNTTRIVIAADNALFRDLLFRALSGVPSLAVVGEAGDGRTAMRMVEKMKPDVVLVDKELGSTIDGAEVAIRLRMQKPNLGIVILSSYRDLCYISRLPFRAWRGCAHLLKQNVCGVDSLVVAIEKTKSGMTVLDPQLTWGHTSSWVSKLPPAKHEVLTLVAQGYNNSAISNRLNLSTKTVENYINSIYLELGLNKASDLNSRVKATLVYLESLRMGSDKFSYSSEMAVVKVR